jgi:hypothetical protein
MGFYWLRDGMHKKWMGSDRNFFGKGLRKNSGITWPDGKWLADQKTKGVWELSTLGL